MAIDTETRRRSALALCPGSPAVDPVADAAIGPEDRAHACGLFSRSSIFVGPLEGVEAILIGAG